MVISFKPITKQPSKEDCKLSTTVYHKKGSRKNVKQCPYCLKERSRSRNHKTRHALLCHIAVVHKDAVNIWGNLHGD